MRFFTLLHATMAAIIVAAATATAQPTIDKNRSAMSPDQQFGFGINNAGLHIQYAMGPAFHLGFNLNLDVDRTNGQQANIYHFGPYAKFIFSGNVINPYLLGAIGVLRPGTGKLGIYGRYQQSDTVDIRLPDTELSLKLGGGGEYFFSRNVGVYGHVNVLDAVLASGSPDPNFKPYFSFGLIGGVIGIEFFF